MGAAARGRVVMLWMVGAWAMLSMVAAPPQTPVVAHTDSTHDLTSQTTKPREQAHNAPQSALESSADSSTPVHAVEYLGTISAYSCDAHPANGMHPCGLFRDGTRPHAGLHGLVAAGPYEWLGRTVYVEGFGSVTLVDTPRNAWYGEKVHIDIFMGYAEAVRHGIQERTVYLE